MVIRIRPLPLFSCRIRPTPDMQVPHCSCYVNRTLLPMFAKCPRHMMTERVHPSIMVTMGRSFFSAKGYPLSAADAVLVPLRL